MKTAFSWAGALVAATLAVAMCSCGTVGAPQPPSLNLPDRVTDLAAVRTGNEVRLTWVMPKRNTDKLPLKANVAAAVCRRERSEACVAVGEVRFGAAANATFTDTLPAALASGGPRALSYFVELKNRNGRSAGLSNAAVVVAGAAPEAVAGLAATVRKSGVVLSWNRDGEADAVRLERTLLNPAPAKAHQGMMAPKPEPAKQNLLVEPDAADKGLALDKSIVFGQSYEYRAQRVARITVDGQMLELAGVVSLPIRVDAVDVFPPAVPTGLAAVATAADSASGTPASIDLSWQPDTDADLAGYEVYRREDATPWRRISGLQLIVGPAFHDAQVVPGHTYRYGVSAVDQGGRESSRSDEAQETVPEN
jgi:hypothetical protein